MKKLLDVPPTANKLVRKARQLRLTPHSHAGPAIAFEQRGWLFEGCNQSFDICLPPGVADLESLSPCQLGDGGGQLLEARHIRPLDQSWNHADIPFLGGLNLQPNETLLVIRPTPPARIGQAN